MTGKRHKVHFDSGRRATRGTGTRTSRVRAFSICRNNVSVDVAVPEFAEHLMPEYAEHLTTDVMQVSCYVCRRHPEYLAALLLFEAEVREHVAVLLDWVHDQPGVDPHMDADAPIRSVVDKLAEHGFPCWFAVHQPQRTLEHLRAARGHASAVGQDACSDFVARTRSEHAEHAARLRAVADVREQERKRREELLAAHRAADRSRWDAIMRDSIMESERKSERKSATPTQRPASPSWRRHRHRVFVYISTACWMVVFFVVAQAFCRGWSSDWTPSNGVIVGKRADDDKWVLTIQECIDAGACKTRDISVDKSTYDLAELHMQWRWER